MVILLFYYPMFLIISHTICHVESASASLPMYLETLLADKLGLWFCERIERYCFVGLHCI
jgi:hypothetical protein